MRAFDSYAVSTWGLILTGAVLATPVSGCGDDGASGSLSFVEESDVAQDFSLDGGGEAPSLGPVCPVDSTRCADNVVLTCADGQWQVLLDCGDTVCVDGACQCEPNCDGRMCGADGCGGACGTCDPGVTCDDDSGVCVAPATKTVYTAVYVEDIWGGSCSSYLSSGSDIRGAALYTPEGEFAGYWDEVAAEPGTEGCQNEYTSPDVVLGEPTTAQLALQGGWVVGTFEGKNAIGPGWSFEVYEYDGDMGGSSETYGVWLATGLDCMEAPDPKNDCMIPVSGDGFGSTAFSVKE